MKILVTGGAGFIGSHVVDEYILLGHEVIVVDNLYSGKIEYVNKKAKFYKIDIRDKNLEEIFLKEKPECINHHAAQINLRKSVEDPIFDADVNILGSLNLFNLALKYNVKKIIFASTGGAIYGEQEYFPADENHPIRPLSPYGIAKFTIEKYLEFYRISYGINYVSLRYANVYGPRQDPYGEAGVVAIFTKKMLNNEDPIIFGDGEQTRDFVYVKDVVLANVLALNLNHADIFNIGTAVETSVNELFKKLKKLTKSNVKEIHGEPKLGEQRRSVLSFEKAKKILGWYPRFSLDEGLKLTVEYFKNV